MQVPAAGAIELGYGDLAVAGALVVFAGAASIALRLGIERRLALASVRTVAQLLVVGYVLRWVFAVENPWLVGLFTVVMVAVASREAVRRPSRRFAGAGWLSFASLAASALLTTVVVTGVVVGADPWWMPQYFIPLLGMILGNGLTGVSLCLDYLLEGFSARRGEVETALACGATPWEASRPLVRQAVRRGMIPIINSMMVVGIVSLPGMMTGQVLAGADPLQAVKYQIVVMFMLACAITACCILLSVMVQGRLFNDRQQLRWQAIRAQAD